MVSSSSASVLMWMFTAAFVVIGRGFSVFRPLPPFPLFPVLPLFPLPWPFMFWLLFGLT
ncbi:hypothetical protein A2U01_0115000, partial [Trifolium medium]|nr:hypothetical protein [Trifolium medium]